MLAKSHLKWIKRVALVAVPIGYDQAFERKLLRILCFGKGSLCNGLASVLRQHRLGVKAFHVTHATVHEKPNNTLSLRLEVGFAIRRSPSVIDWRLRHSRAVSMQHRTESKPCEAES